MLIVIDGFNPKREVRPSQTLLLRPVPVAAMPFQSQTGSQALSDQEKERYTVLEAKVSIPNGKSGPLRHGCPIRGHIPWILVSIPNGKSGPLRPTASSVARISFCSFNPKREVRPSQTRKLSMYHDRTSLVSIPNGKSGPLRLLKWGTGAINIDGFQSQTGSQALSD